jgi:hypothetical protein
MVADTCARLDRYRLISACASRFVAMRRQRRCGLENVLKKTAFNHCPAIASRAQPGHSADGAAVFARVS